MTSSEQATRVVAIATLMRRYGWSNQAVLKLMAEARK
jgi:hypothetical protein